MKMKIYHWQNLLPFYLQNIAITEYFLLATLPQGTSAMISSERYL